MRKSDKDPAFNLLYFKELAKQPAPFGRGRVQQWQLGRLTGLKSQQCGEGGEIDDQLNLMITDL